MIISMGVASYSNTHGEFTSKGSIIGKIIAMGLGIAPIARLNTRSLYAMESKDQDKFVIGTKGADFLLEVFNGQKICWQLGYGGGAG